MNYGPIPATTDSWKHFQAHMSKVDWDSSSCSVKYFSFFKDYPMTLILICNPLTGERVHIDIMKGNMHDSAGNSGHVSWQFTVL